MASMDKVSSQVYNFLNSAVTPTTTVPAPVKASYCVQNYAQIYFMKWESELSRGGKVTVSDSQQEVVFRASRECHDGHMKGILRDEWEQLMVVLKKKIGTSSNTWVAYRGEDESDSDVSFSVVREDFHGVSPTYKISLAKDLSEVPAFTVVGNVLKNNFSVMYKDAPVAKIISSPFFKDDGYRITLYRGTDTAFIVSLLLIINQFPEHGERLSDRTSTFSKARRAQQEEKKDLKQTEAAAGAQEEDRRPTRAATFPRARTAQQKAMDDPSLTGAISDGPREEGEYLSTLETATLSISKRDTDDSKKTAFVEPLPLVPVSSNIPVTNLTQFLIMQKNRFFDEALIPVLVSLANRYTAGQQSSNRILCYEFPHPHSAQQGPILPSPSWTTTADSELQQPIFSPFRAAVMVLIVLLSMAVLISVLGAVIVTMAALVNMVMGMFMVIGMVIGAVVVLGVGIAVIVGIATGTPVGLVAKGDVAKGTAELHVRNFSGRFRYHLSNGSRLGIVELKYRKFSCSFNFPM